MSDIERAVLDAIATEGRREEANRAYLAFMKANFFVPIENKGHHDEPEVLFLSEHDHVFLPVFSDRTYFDTWAHPIQDSVQILHLSGLNLLQGIGDHVSVCFNPGTTSYKIFQPAEIMRMRQMMMKLGLIQDANRSQPE